MIEIQHLTKRYGPTVAVEELSFVVRPGTVTGFLGPNGAGKSTTMRVILGLDAPTRGRALVNGRPYASLRRPMHQVGALLDAGAVHPGRSALDHLRCLARSNRIGLGRVTQVLEQVGLAGVARQEVGAFSLGMRQRLGIAAVLIGDPGVLLFDEPVNGLDPEGIRWIRELLQSLAAEGRTVLLSSHLMSEMALTAQALVIIGRGRLIAETTVQALADSFQQGVLVASPHAAELTRHLQAAGATVTPEPPGGLPGGGLPTGGLPGSGLGGGEQPSGGLLVAGLDAGAVGEVAAAHAIPLSALIPRSASLEDAYLALTDPSVDYRAAPIGAAAAAAGTTPGTTPDPSPGVTPDPTPDGDPAAPTPRGTGATPSPATGRPVVPEPGRGPDGAPGAGRPARSGSDNWQGRTAQ